MYEITYCKIRTLDKQSQSFNTIDEVITAIRVLVLQDNTILKIKNMEQL